MTFAACAHAVEDETLASDRSALQPRTLSPTNARAEFRDPTVERRYMHAKPQLRLHTCLTAIVALVLTALVARTAYVASIGASADAWLAPFTGAVLTLAFASVLLALVATRCTGRTLPCAFSEAACPALVCATLVLVPLALARRDMHGGHADDALDACALASQRATISSVYLNRVLLALALLAVCSPVRPRCFEVVMLCASFGGVWLHFVAGRALPAWMHAVDLAAFFAVELLLLRACHLLAHSRRAESRLSGVAAAAEEWRVRTELETEQRQQQEQATQEARSRLVRMVMHDLRSPLLTISNSVEMLTDQIQLTQQPRAAHARPPEGGGGASGGGAASAAGDRQAETEAHAEPLAWECLRSVRVCTQLMEDIMSDMLDFERISSGRLLLVWAPFQVEQLLGAAQCTFAGLCEAKGVRLVCGAVPRALEGRWFRADLRRLQQCLNNGLSNAIKFTDGGGTISLDAHAPARPRPRASGEDEDGGGTAAAGFGDEAGVSVVVVVRDSGVGLSAEELRTLRAGSLFEQVGRGKLQGNGGTGLGLSISREILNLHRGSTLEISSEGHGRGTSYEMALRLEEVAAPAPLDVQAEALLVPSLSARGGAAPPAARVGEPGGDGGGVDSAARAQFGAAAAEGQGDTEPSAAAASAAGAGAQPGAPPAAAPKPHFDDSFLCLHVEDDALLRKSLELRVFRKLGIRFRVAENGEAAVRMVLAEGLSPTVILMDNQMPVMDGAAATRALRQGGFEGVIIGMTGDPSGCAERREFEACGLNGCVDKTRAGTSTVQQRLLAFARRAERLSPTTSPEARARLAAALPVVRARCKPSPPLRSRHPSAALAPKAPLPPLVDGGDSMPPSPPASSPPSAPRAAAHDGDGSSSHGSSFCSRWDAAADLSDASTSRNDSCWSSATTPEPADRRLRLTRRLGAA